MSRKNRKKQKPVFPKEIPQEFFDRLTAMFGDALSSELQQTFIERPTTFRVNTLRAKTTDILAVLKEKEFELEQVAWLSDTYILRNKEKRDICDLDIYTDAQIYLQSIASMIPPLVLDPKPGDTVLDLTAAPGSKTSQMAIMMKQEGELVANDKNKIRFFKLKHNMEQQGVIKMSSPYQGELEGVGRNDEHSLSADTTGARTKDPSQPPLVGEENWKVTLRMEPGTVLLQEYEQYFDKILLDAPCSSEARFVSTNNKTFGYWKDRKVKEMAYTQRRLLLSAWKSLKPGGTLVYSTCTFAPEENEMQIDRLLERFDDVQVLPVEIPDVERLPIMKEWEGKTLSPEVQKCFRVKPTKDIEGFFIAKLQKK
ncbi:MAG: hypothetical protein CO030_00510 [Candidatus Magasanikbacteria bacterium CG_4_9_14_0_2_um_filter_42_11]|uniref:SAM-dependent MTase RsmB/NOP-type domain-containing protein n=1 Tax=Candidatus Magasanikbacteria bacterium CG_4_9_14_0_2_um_filter_42_11 TaxID=1974643 RepID=A0A2M8FB28_9BACT|nr:MAG: hypothetical protein COU34_01920 [Candidatus Magasanikbacteria bacterium CG10_big_fil_rev_8_21_14_0_10_43_9]PIY92347.1 MAG: hypothetical protein COY70_03735 [Candidatus Magasanikbacteria bacterium CG_4_10_14_0_8_um_filter_42_12]PJC52889.1 MAG: hypothetical protein CO030_00510 [Candidatus Magasanikbacteria bacterium CG_4_9_14_0_2_um_filter_42_11]